MTRWKRLRNKQRIRECNLFIKTATENIMLQHSLSCLEDSVVKYLMVREEDRKSGKEFLEELSTKWLESLDSYMQTSECGTASNGWKDGCLAY